MAVLLAACHTDFTDIPHTVTAVRGGDTLVLKNGVAVSLIGVEGNAESQSFLEEHVLNQKVQVRFDRSNYPEVDEGTELVWGYATTLRGEALNGELLRRGLTPLDELYLTDSLNAFRRYAQSGGLVPEYALPEESEAADPEAPLEARPPVRRSDESVAEALPDEEVKPRLNSFADLVEYAEQCVFVVLRRNAQGRVDGQGTGFFIGEGLAVSNYHVFEGSNDWYIRAHDGRRYPVTEILKQSREFDFVVFRVATKTYPFLDLAKATPRKGTDIFVLGNPRGLESTVTRGVVSAIRKKTYSDAMLQIDAAISPGSSGSPVMNLQGEVVGIATSQLRDCENCNFAMNINLVKK
ncbi:serine protease Do [Catalinimonas alkaloidigena]|uniref:Serine protease Do n=2 Tax=Catalinimonas alkaloidigena TaxID=1075417 RepID=A0A1G9LP47_9BACT|nr:serine protease Do [Catalinimonas alkaloidigena]